MGFLKGLGSFAGKVVGGVVGGGLEVAGSAMGNNFLQEVGQGVYHTTVRSGEMLGGLGDSAVTTVHGIVTEDGEKVKEGLGEAGQLVKTTAFGVGRTLKHTASNASQIVSGVLNDDLEAAGRGARELVKTVAVSTLSIGFCDMVFDVVDEPLISATEVVGDTVIAASEITETVTDIDMTDEVFGNAITASEIVGDTNISLLPFDQGSEEMPNFDNTLEQESEVHWVEPHQVNSYFKTDGTYVEGYWRDGDGDTSINLSTEQGGGYTRSNLLA